MPATASRSAPHARPAAVAVAAATFLGLLVVDAAPASATTINGCAIEPNTYCPGYDLRGADLRGVNLSSANLSGADLSNADLSGAILLFANLSGAVVRGTKFVKANLYGASLSNVGRDMIGKDAPWFHGADLSYADLHGAHLNQLSDAILTGADMTSTLLPGATFYGITEMEGTRFAGTDFRTVYGDQTTDFTGSDIVPAVDATTSSQSGTTVAFQVPAVDTPGLTSSCSPASGRSFPVGTTMVECQIFLAGADPTYLPAKARFPVSVSFEAPPAGGGQGGGASTGQPQASPSAPATPSGAAAPTTSTSKPAATPIAAPVADTGTSFPIMVLLVAIAVLLVAAVVLLVWLLVRRRPTASR